MAAPKKIVTYFSPSTLGFHNTDVHTPEQIPSDAVVIPESLRQQILDDQAAGKMLVVDPKTGLPSTTEFVLTPAQELAHAKMATKDALNFSDKVMMRIQEAVAIGVTTWDKPDVVTYINYRIALRTLMKVTVAQPLPKAPPYPAGT